MAHPQLDNLVRIGQLQAEPADAKEIEGLLRTGQYRLEDAQRQELSLESRFALGYNAAHAFALSALRAQGYRSDSRYLVFQCLQHTVDLPAEQWRVLNDAHQRRNLVEYKGETNLNGKLFDALMKVAQEVAARAERLIAQQ